MLRILIVLAAAGIVGWLLWRRFGKSVYPMSLTPPNLPAVVTRQVRLWPHLPEALRDKLVPRVREFVERIPFEGANGFAVTDEMRKMIATQACIVTLGWDDYPFDDLHGITLHPDEFVVDESDEDEETGVVTEGYRVISGQSQGSDRIVLSWRDVADGQTRDDGYNVVIHEITHFLEHSHPGGDRATRSALKAAYESLREAVSRGEETLLDPYGAEDLTEFLAVSAEFFFERPVDLRDRHPTLYVLLRESFKLDPAAWFAPDSDLFRPSAISLSAGTRRTLKDP
ncbi:MAG: zinc-dependent peptidase [Gammaproteobacteria bacterium]|nr:zinc-dependent peptidase [Gammaproteobacteria bacterium]